MERVRKRIESRRALVEAQCATIEIQATLCDSIREVKDKRMEDRIKKLGEDDPALHEYIRMLESIRYGIWCDKCDRIKNLSQGVQTAMGVNVNIPELNARVEEAEISNAAKEYLAHLNTDVTTTTDTGAITDISGDECDIEIDLDSVNEAMESMEKSVKKLKKAMRKADKCRGRCVKLINELRSTYRSTGGLRAEDLLK